MTLIDLANPIPFLTLTARILPWLVATTVILLLRTGAEFCCNSFDPDQEMAAALP